MEEKMEEEKIYEEYVKENYDELVKDYCQDNSTDFETYCSTEFHIMQEFADNDAGFEEYCRDRYKR